jgi:sarcosine oxidase subunit gamma
MGHGAMAERVAGAGSPPAGAGGAARSPLARRAEDLAAAGAREVAFLALVNLRVDAAPAERVRVPLPATPNTWSGGDGREALWLGPDDYLVVGEPGTAPALVAELRAALDGLHHSVVDVSAGQAVVDLAGDARSALLAQGCGLDLHPRSWHDGRCAQTLLARVPVLLQERADATRIFVRPSFAAYLAGWLRRVAVAG